MNPVDMGIGWAQRAVYEALTSDGGITIDSVAVPVRADVMPNQQPPYILLTNRAEDRWNVHSGLGSDVIIAVEVITRGNGHYERAQLHEIMNQVRARLDHQGIQITPQTYPPIPAPEPTATEHDDKHYLPPDYEPEPTPVPPETVPTINGCLFESALIIDEPDGETLRGESRYRIYLRAPSGD